MAHSVTHSVTHSITHSISHSVTLWLALSVTLCHSPCHPVACFISRCVSRCVTLWLALSVTLCPLACHSMACFASGRVACSTYLVIHARWQLDRSKNRLRVRRGGLYFMLMLCAQSQTQCSFKLSLPTQISTQVQHRYQPSPYLSIRTLQPTTAFPTHLSIE